MDSKTDKSIKIGCDRISMKDSHDSPKNGRGYSTPERLGKVSRNGKLYNRIISINNAGMLDMADVIKDLFHYEKTRALDLVALQVAEPFEDYVRGCISEATEPELSGAGHYTMLLEYAKAQNLPLLALKRDATREDIEEVRQRMLAKDYHNLVSVINQESRDALSQIFSDLGFSIE